MQLNESNGAPSNSDFVGETKRNIESPAHSAIRTTRPEVLYIADAAAATSASAADAKILIFAIPRFYFRDHPDLPI